MISEKMDPMNSNLYWAVIPARSSDAHVFQKDHRMRVILVRFLHQTWSRFSAEKILSYSRATKVACELFVWAFFASVASEALTLHATAQTVTSGLWGVNGEVWTPQSRLPDFSFAGYRRGEFALPNPSVVTSVRKFGAVGDGTTDDTAAFNTAIAATSAGVILVPAGRYKITNLITIDKSKIVLRGEGAKVSILYFPHSLTDVLPKWSSTTTGTPTSLYSWCGGFVCINGSLGQSDLVSIVAPFAVRGDYWIPLSTVARLQVGQWVTVKVSDDAAFSLSKWLYNGDSDSITSLKKQTAKLVAKIAQIDTTGKRVRIDAPLRFDIKPEWNPKLQTFNPTVENSGVEDLGFEFPCTPYRGHFTELGYNPIQIQGAANCWIRRIRVMNPDSGPFLAGTFCTLSGIVMTSDRAPFRSNRGHHGITATGSDNLIEDFNIQFRFIHDLSVQSASAGNVFQNGKAEDICFDQHKQAPYANLFTNIDGGAGTRIWKCGGGENLGKNSAGWTTFWNVKTKTNINYPPTTFGPPATMNFVGLKTTQPNVISQSGKWFETMSCDSLVPQNLHTSQLNRRMGRNAGSGLNPSE
jgi:hypothetical protein